MPVGTLATVKALDPDDLRAMRRGDDPRQRVSSAPAPGRRARARARRTARFMQLGRADPHRLRGLPGVLARARCAPSSEDGVEFRSHIDGSKRRFTPEIRHAHRAQPRRGRDHAVRSRHSRTERSGRRARGERAQHAWLAPLPRRVRAAGAPRIRSPGDTSRRSFRSCRAASTRPCAARRRAPMRDMGDWHGLRHRRPIGRRGQARHVPHARGGGRGAAARPAALPHGRRLSRRTWWRGSPRRRSVRLRRPTRMGRNGAAFTRDGRLNIKRAEFRADPPAARRGRATAPPARDSRAPTCATCSSPTRSSGCASSPCTMYISSCR